MVRMMRYPREAAIAARPMPVLPLVGSMMTEPDWSWPDASCWIQVIQLEQEPGIQTMCLGIIPWLQKRCFPDQFRYGGVNVHRDVLYRDGFRFLLYSDRNNRD